MILKKLKAAALLFDMDGTLVDSGAVVEGTWAIWAKRYALPLTEVLAYSHGRPTLATMEHFGERVAPGRDWRSEALGMQQLEEEQSAETKPIAGAHELLPRLDVQRWAVVTSAPRLLAEKRIAAAGLPLPRVLVPADEISMGKPHPEGYLKAAHELGFAPGECIVFEDTPPGVEAGINAGMQVIGLLTTVPAERLGTPHLIRNYHDLRITSANGLLEIEFNSYPS